MTKRGIFLAKEDYKEAPFFSMGKTKNTPIIDQILLDKVFSYQSTTENKPFSKIMNDNINQNVILRGFINSGALKIFAGYKEHLSNKFKNNVFAIKQEVDIRNPYANEICFFYLSNQDIQNNGFVNTENTPIEIEGVVKQNPKLPFIKYIEVKNIKRITPTNFFASKPFFSYNKLIDIFNELYGNRDLAEALVINLISSPNDSIKNPLILPLNKTLSPKDQSATDVKSMHDVILNDLQKLFNPIYFKKDNPFIRINWIKENFNPNTSLINGLNIYPSNEFMIGNEFYNKKAVFPIFLNTESMNYDNNNTLLELDKEIRTSLFYYKIFPKDYSIKTFDKKNIDFFKKVELSKEDDELKLFLGTSSPSYLNNPSIYARTGCNYMMGKSLNKVKEFPFKEIERINENTLVTEFADVISGVQKRILINQGNKFMKIQDNRMKALIRGMNDIMSTGKIHGINNYEMEDLLRKTQLKLEHIEQALELGIIIRGFEGLRPHYYHIK